MDQTTKECVTSTRTEDVDASTVSLQVVDIPGWWKFFDARLVPSRVRAQIDKAFEMTKTSPNPRSRAVFLLMLPADTSFKEEQRINLIDNLRPLGDSVWDKTIVVFTGGHWLQDFDLEQHIESEDALVWLVDRCANRYFTFDAEADQSRLSDQGNQLIKMVLDLGLSAPKRNRTAKRKRSKPEESIKVTVDLQKTPLDLDEGLKKMVNVLHQVWGFGDREIQEIRSRLENRPFEDQEISSMLQPPGMDRSSIDRFIEFNRAKVEDIIRDVTEDKTLEDLLNIVTEIYFRKECGAFDIVSIICESERFKPEWRSLFEREWARRESRLMEYTYTKYFRINASEERQRRRDYTERWLSSEHEPEWIERIDHSIKTPVYDIISRVKQATTGEHYQCPLLAVT